MKIHILILLNILLSSNYLHASTSSKITELTTLARQQYKEGNYDNAISLYKQAEAFGSPNAMLQLSSIYKIGKATAKDENLAKKYLHDATNIYEKQANNSDADAQFNLGKIYSYHIKPHKKLEAFNWHLKAANNGHMKAQYAVATTLDRGTLEPEIKRNHEEALKWYEKSAEQGNSGAAFQLVYKNSGDFDYVLKWCMPIAKKQGDRWSSKCLEAINIIVGRKMFFGEYRQKSIDAIHELANSNIIMSQVTLALMYEKGDVLTKNIEDAEKWASRAFNTALSKAQSGDKQSQYELALLYQRGIGTNIYIDQTRVWLSKSAKQGYKPAIKTLTKLKKE